MKTPEKKFVEIDGSILSNNYVVLFAEDEDEKLYFAIIPPESFKAIRVGKGKIQR